MRKAVFPFTAVLGQENIKKALIWNLVNPAVGGVLIAGEKGTAKSTLVRGMAVFLKDRKIVELPLNVTEDRLVGAIDFQRAMKGGENVLDPGILKEADGNILYVDEVNLLSDYIVDVLLETTGTKLNIVEREGISCSHSSDFILVGSMNQEEGQLRSQFLDRFGLYVEAEGEKDLALRVEIMERRLAFEQDPLRFIQRYQEETQVLSEKIQEARLFLPEVEISRENLMFAAYLSSQSNCVGHRGELAVIEAARAIAALDRRAKIEPEDILEAAALALVHRMKEFSLDLDGQSENPDNQTEKTEQTFSNQETDNSESENDAGQEANTVEKVPETSGKDKKSRNSEESDENRAEDEKKKQQKKDNRGKNQNFENLNGNFTARLMPLDGGEQLQPVSDQNWEQAADFPTDSGEAQESRIGRDEIEAPGEIFQISKWQEGVYKKALDRSSGRRRNSISPNQQGRYVRYRLAGEEKVTDLAFDATLRAAAPFQHLRDRQNRAIAIEKDDMRVKIREKRSGGCILFVVDASSSMNANRRMQEVKAAILSLLNVSYQKRDRVGMIAFRKGKAELLLGFTGSVELAQKELEELPTGGTTPLAAGLDLAYEVTMTLLMREPDARPTIVLVSDGKATSRKWNNDTPFDEALEAAEKIGKQGLNTIILDTTEKSGKTEKSTKASPCSRLNEKLHGTLLTMEEIRAEGIVEAVAQYQK